MEAANLNPTELSRLSGLDRKTITDMMDGLRAPRKTTFQRACEAMGANPHFILWGAEPMLVPAGEPVQFAAERPPSTSHLQPVQLPGVERWLADHGEVSPDERSWLRTAQFPMPHTKYPDMVYRVLLATYQQMRDFRPFDGAAPPGGEHTAAHS